MHYNARKHWQRGRGVGWIRFSHLLIGAEISSIFRVDLTVANRVHLIEPHWNPMAEAQAVDRVHRIGQTREVVVTRYIMRNSIETVRQEGLEHDINWLEATY